MGGRALVGLEILLEYGRVRRDLRRRGVRAAVAAVARPEERDDPRQRTIAFRMGRAVDLTLSVLPSDARCLTRSLVLSRVLARRGVGSRIVIGVKPPPQFTAHAWVEHRGHALLPAGDYAQERLTEL